jgi:glycosyltransferase involved in cell wall biosynthesis
MLLPNKLFEYLMAGLPVLASQLDAVAEVIQAHDVGQVVSSLEPADVGAAMHSLLADQNTLRRWPNVHTAGKRRGATSCVSTGKCCKLHNFSAERS